MALEIEQVRASNGGFLSLPQSRVATTALTQLRGTRGWAKLAASPRVISGSSFQLLVNLFSQRLDIGVLARFALVGR